MAYWLFKSEPETWSWDQQVAQGKAGQAWDGVRNFAARNHMRAMKKGDKGFFYHTGGEKRIVGTVTVIGEAHPEKADPAWECVDLAADKPLPKPVDLAHIRAEPTLADMVLVRQARLSVQPVSAQEWEIVCRLGGLKA